MTRRRAITALIIVSVVASITITLIAILYSPGSEA
jgi:hypothetical protein